MFNSTDTSVKIQYYFRIFSVINLIASGLFLYGIVNVSSKSSFFHFSCSQETLFGIKTFTFFQLFANAQKKPLCMFPEVLLNFIGIFAALLSFIITLVWGIRAMYSEMDRNNKLQSFPIIIFWFLLISKQPYAQFFESIIAILTA